MATKARQYVTVLLHGPAEALEAGSWVLFQAGAQGLVQEENRLSAFFSLEDWPEAEPRLNDLLARARAEFPGLALSLGDQVAPDQWLEKWKEFHRPVTVGPLWIGPPWLVHQAGPDQKRLVIDPGQAFGTGAHETTRLGLEAVVKFSQERGQGSLLDVGTGSGVLALAGLLLGLGPALGLDNDPLALEAATDNARANGLTRGLSLSDQDLSTVSQRFDLVLANLTGPVLKTLAPYLVRVVAPGGWLVLSGLLVEEKDIILVDFSSKLKLVGDSTQGEWAGLVLTRP